MHEREQCKINCSRHCRENRTITKDMSFGEIAKLLEEKKLIKDKNVFRIQYMLSEYKGEIEPGSYVLNTSQTAEEMLRVVSQADEKETETE